MSLLKAFKNKKISYLPWYVLLTSVYFPLTLFVNNLGETTIGDVWRSLLISFLLGMVMYWILFAVTRDMQKAGLISLVLGILIFSYGHLYSVLISFMLFGQIIGRHRYLFPFSLAIAGLIVYFVMKYNKETDLLTKTINIVVVMLIIFQLTIVIIHGISTFAAQSRSTPTSEIDYSDDIGFEQRDIYLIVLDAYPRSDWLSESKGVDNSEFLKALEELDFYVVSCSRSNYNYTTQSMTSVFNMVYVQNLNVPLTDVEISNLLKHSKVRNTLSDFGYEFIFFETGYPSIEMRDADQFIEADKQTSNLNDFELMYLNTTIYKLIDNSIARLTYDPNNPRDLENAVIRRHALRVISVFKNLKEPLRNEKPVFVYAHIVSPHVPRVFNADGTINYHAAENPDLATRSTFQYINNETIKTIKSIINRSDPDPIIILMSDHGAGDFAYDNLNLNAYHLPYGGSESLYPTITPVNTFRVIFNTYFQYNLPLLDDISYYSPESSRYDFEVIQDPYDYCQELNQEFSQ